MFHEQEYICWKKNQSESDGIEIKAMTPKEAARKAMETWKHERELPLSGDKLIICMRDESQRVQEMELSMPSRSDRTGEAFI